MKNINKTTVLSVMVGLAGFGVVVFLLKKYGGATGSQVAATITQ